MSDGRLRRAWRRAYRDPLFPAIVAVVLIEVGTYLCWLAVR